MAVGSWSPGGTSASTPFGTGWAGAVQPNSGIVQGNTMGGSSSGGGGGSNPWGSQYVSSNPADAYGQVYAPVANEAFRLYQNNEGFNPFPTSTVHGQSANTQSALNTLGNATTSQGIYDAIGFAGQTASQGGLNDQQRMLLMNGINPVAMGEQQITTAPGYQEIYGRTQDGNPYFQQMLEGQLQGISDQIKRDSSGSGRYGSGAMYGRMGEQLGNVQAQTLYNQYNQDQQTGLAALQGQSNVEGANIANRVGAAQTGIGIYDQGIARALQASGMLPGLEQAKYMAPQMQLSAGQMQDQFNQSLLDSEVARHMDEHSAPWNRLQMLGNTTGAINMPGQNLSYMTGQGQLALNRDQFQSQQPSGIGQALGTVGAIGTIGNQLTGGALGDGIGNWLSGILG